MREPGPIPRYQRIKQQITRRIEAGELAPGDQVPSENMLVRQLGVSRMTANRALRELTSEGLLVRVQGSGTFVAETRPPADLLELRNIADEIRASGRRPSQRLELLETVSADAELARDMEVAPGAELFHSIIVHMADGAPVQIEDRYVNPAVAPDYMKMDFDHRTPNEILMQVAPRYEAEHIVEAVRPRDWEQDLLGIGANEPCLQLRRRTWSGGKVVTRVRLLHPGHSHRFGARFAGQGIGAPL